MDDPAPIQMRRWRRWSNPVAAGWHRLRPGRLHRLQAPGSRKATRISAAIVAGLLGGALAVAVAGGMSHRLGPLDVHLQMPPTICAEPSCGWRYGPSWSS
jgi:hypothetical protein